MVVPNHTCDWDFEFEPVYAYVCVLCVWFIYFQTYINCLLKPFFFQSQLWLMHMHTCVSVHLICIYSSIRNTPKAVEHGWLVFSSVSLFCDLQNKNNNSKGAEQQRRKQTFAFQQIKGMIQVKKKVQERAKCSCMTQKCENQKGFSCLIAFHTLLCCWCLLHFGKKGSDGFLPLSQHGDWGEAGTVNLLWEYWKSGHRAAAGEIRVWWQLSTERQQHSAGGLLSVCEVSCRRSGTSVTQSASFLVVVQTYEFARIFLI